MSADNTDINTYTIKHSKPWILYQHNIVGQRFYVSNYFANIAKF